MNEYRKVIDMRISNGIKNRTKTSKQIQSSRRAGLKVMLNKNPMKNPEIAKKHGLSRRGRKNSPETIEKMRQARLKNPISYWKGKHLPEKTKAKLSMVQSGKKNSPTQIITASQNFIENNPMKNPEIAKKQHKNKNTKEAARRHASTNPSFIKNWPRNKNGM